MRADKFDLASAPRTLSMASGRHSARSRGKASTDAAFSHTSDAALEGALADAIMGRACGAIG
jgi:hypothetical protein